MKTNGLSQLTFSAVWHVMAPEMILIAFGFLILLFDLFSKKETSRRYSPLLGILGLIVSIVFIIKDFGVVAANSLDQNQLSNYLYVLDGFGNVFKLIFAVGTLLVLLMAVDFFKHAPKVKVAEYTYLLLFATVGAMVMASTFDLITLFVGLELLSIASYVLVALNRDNPRSTEGAMKYLVVGAVASAIALYGMSFLYGITGQTNIAIGAQSVVSMWEQMKPMLLLSFLLMFVGFGVKIALVPFHQWAPDTYEGASNPITSFLAVVSKAAGFAMILRVFLWSFIQMMPQLYLYFAILAAITMVVGNVAALTQKNIKRLLAYSSVAQAGYLLLPLAVIGKVTADASIWLSLSETVFYLGGYLFMTIGAFAVLSSVTRKAGNETIEAFRGLYHRSPFQAVAMSIFMLSMAGMPITVGFFGKFYILLNTVQTHLYWLGGLLFLTSAIAFYYYFGVLKAMFMKETSEAVTTDKAPLTWPLNVVVWIGVLGTLVLGVFPNLFLHFLNGLKWFG